MKQFHECELKLKIANCVEQIEIEDILKGLGYKYNMSRLERDYIIDDSNFSLRKKSVYFVLEQLLWNKK